MELFLLEVDIISRQLIWDYDGFSSLGNVTVSGEKKGRFRVPGNIYSAYMFYRKLFIQCDNISIYFRIINYKSSSPARTIPACRHFLNRQYWHRFLCTLFISHSPEPPTHVYTRRFWTVRLKKPLHLKNRGPSKLDRWHRVDFI